MNRRINVRGIIINDDRLFCQMLKKEHSDETPSYWCTSGGGMDDGESIHDAQTGPIYPTDLIPSVC